MHSYKSSGIYKNWNWNFKNTQASRQRDAAIVHCVVVFLPEPVDRLLSSCRCCVSDCRPQISADPSGCQFWSRTDGTSTRTPRRQPSRRYRYIPCLFLWQIVKISTRRENYLKKFDDDRNSMPLLSHASLCNTSTTASRAASLQSWRVPR